MDSINDETGRQSVLRQCCTNNSGFARAQRRHGIEKMSNAGCTVRDSLHDSGRRCLAVPDRDPHTRHGHSADEACRNTLRRQRDHRLTGASEFTQLLKVAGDRLCNSIGPMNSRTPRADERAFEVQPDDTVPAADGTSRCDSGLYALSAIGDQSRKTGGRTKPAVRARNRAHTVRRRLIVQKNAAAPIDLQIDKAGGKKSGLRKPCLRPIPGHLIRGPNSRNAPAPNHHRGSGMPAMAIKHAVRKDRVPFGGLK